MKGNWQFLILAFLLAGTAWFFVSGRERVDAWIELPVEFTGVQKDIVVRRGLRNRIEVRVRGPQGLVRNLDTKNVAYSLDLSSIKPGMNTVNLDPESLPLPGSIEVIEIDPPRLQVVADRIEEKVVGILPQWSGELDEHYFLQGNETIPAVTKIRGPKEFVDRIDDIPTQVVEVEDSTPDILVVEDVPLALPDEISADPHEVQMRLVFDVEKEELDMEAPVRVDNFTGYDVAVAPKHVNVTLQAPVPLLEDGTLKESLAVNVVVGENLEAGVHELPYIPVLPTHVTMESSDPETITVTLTPRPGARPVDDSTRSKSNKTSPRTQGLNTP